MFTAASIFLRMGNLKKKQSLIVVAILQIWDGLTRCDQPPPATLPGPRAGWHGTAPAPPAQACGVRSLRPRRPPLRLSVARRRPSPVPNVPHRPASPSAALPLPPRSTLRSPSTHRCFRFVILIRLTERRGRWTDARAPGTNSLATKRTSVHHI